MYAVFFTAIATVALLALLVRRLEPRLAFFPTPGVTQTPRDFGLAYESVTIDTADGVRLRAWIVPAPSPRAHIVYFHGNGANLSNWSPILAGIVRRGYSVLAFDYRGYGESTGRPTERGVYRDVDAVVAHAWVGSARSVPLLYWGRSLGATMAAYAATVRPPDGVILESGFADARAAVRGSPVLRALSLLASYRFPTAEFVNRAKRPVLVMHGDRDTVIPFARGRELFERIETRKQFFTIPGGDHNDDEPQDPDGYWSAIDGFVRGLRPR